MKKKLIAVVVSAMLIVGAVIGGTIAYLQDDDMVVNTFTVGNIKITLDEAEIDDDGVAIPNAPRVQANTYKLMPGHNYIKDPTVHVIADSEECYVRMFVTINNQAALDAMFAGQDEAGDLTAVFGGYNGAIWEIEDTNPEIVDDARTYEFRYYKTVANADTDQDLEPLFTDITVPGFFTGDQLAELEDLNIVIIANAIQADGFADANEAWGAFEVPVP